MFMLKGQKNPMLVKHAFIMAVEYALYIRELSHGKGNRKGKK